MKWSFESSWTFVAFIIGSTMKFEPSPSNVVAAVSIGIGFVIGWYIDEYLVSFLM